MECILRRNSRWGFGWAFTMQQISFFKVVICWISQSKLNVVSLFSWVMESKQCFDVNDESMQNVEHLGAQLSSEHKWCGGKGWSFCVYRAQAKSPNKTNPTGSAGYLFTLPPPIIPQQVCTLCQEYFSDIHPCSPIHVTCHPSKTDTLQGSVCFHCCVSVTLATVIQLRASQTQSWVLCGWAIFKGSAWNPN